MEGLLDVERMGLRIERRVGQLSMLGGKRDPTVSRYCSSGGVSFSGIVPRGKLPEMLHLSDRQARRIVSPLLKRGLLVSDSQKQPLRFGFPEDAMPDYFPNLFAPEMMSELADKTLITEDGSYEGMLFKNGERMAVAVNGELKNIGKWKAEYEKHAGKPIRVNVYNGRIEIFPRDKGTS
jgi:hypothetical protein